MTETAPSATSRSWLPGLAIGLGLALALYTAGWFVAAHLLQRQVEQWIEQQRAGGAALTTAAIGPAGFPLHLNVRVAGVSYAAPKGRGAWTWQTDHVDVGGSVLRPRELELDLSGAHHFAGPWFKPLQVSFKTAALALRLDGQGRVDGANMTIGDGAVAWDGAAALLHADKAEVKVLAVPAAPAPGPEITSRLSVDIEALSVPGPLPAPLTQNIAKVGFTAEVTGAVGDGPLPQILETWRAAGGTLNLKDVALDWPPLYLAGDGTAALDAQLQPMGAFTARVRGFNAVLDAMVEQHRMDKKEAALAKGVLGLMAKNGAGGPEISLPLTVQERMLSAGPLTLFEVPKVEWPAAPPP